MLMLAVKTRNHAVSSVSSSSYSSKGLYIIFKQEIYQKCLDEVISLNLIKELYQYCTYYYLYKNFILIVYCYTYFKLLSIPDFKIFSFSFFFAILT